MWGCDYGPMAGGWWGGFFPGSLFPLLLWGLVIALIVFIVVRVFRSQVHGPLGPAQDRLDSEAIFEDAIRQGRNLT
jgi:uncharacterized membrane protein